jgi:hypothetical protein
MSNLPVDRDKNYMYEMWGTTKLITDYQKLDFLNHNLKKQTELHEMIRNDDDYDDWEYGTEPSYGKIF